MITIKSNLKGFTKTDAFLIDRNGLISRKEEVVTDFNSISDLPSGIARTGRLVLLERPEDGGCWVLVTKLRDVIDVHKGDLKKYFQSIGCGESSIIQWAIKLKGKPKSIEGYEALFELIQEVARQEETCDGNEIMVWDKKKGLVIKMPRFPVQWRISDRGGVICQIGVVVS